jgi:glucuronoarabinoxylan endo-1,4-beta-xylanase
MLLKTSKQMPFEKEQIMPKLMRFLSCTFHSAPRRRLICRISGLAVLAAAGITAQAAPSSINLAANQQVIDGYGFSSAWCGQFSTAKNNALYNTLGFSLLRIRIDPNQYWTDETVNASAAHARGAKVLGTPWSPPAYMKDNTNVVHGSLLPGQYAAYATYLNQAANTIGLDYVSLQNEPDWNPDYEGCVWNGTQFQTFCASNAQVITKPVVMPEAVNFNNSLSDPTLNDATAASHVSIVAGHFYGGGNSVHQNALNKGKHVWETEHYLTGGQSDFNVSMQLAKEVSDAMNNQFSAYFWWWVNDGQNDGTCLVNSSGTIIKPGYILGQFAKWIRPNANRVTTDYNPTANIYVTAYEVTGGTNLVIVALNMGNSQVIQQFNIVNGTVAMLEGYRTSSSESMADAGGYAVSAGSFTAALPAQSVTTFVQTGGAGTPPAPGNLTATAVSGSQIDLAWTPNATNATAYLVERSTDNVIFSQLASLSASATNFSNTGLPGSSTYYYRVRAGNNGVFSLYSNTANATTLPGAPATPTGLTGVAGNGRVTLAWNASGGTPATGYNLKRSTTSGGPYTTVFALTATNFIDLPLSNLTAYYYVVVGTNSYGTSPNSTQVRLTPLPTALPAPWLDQDIGSVGQTGGASRNNTIATVTGSGADIWGNADAFHYDYFLATNDCTIIARVTSVENTDPWAKAGVMIRQTLAAGSSQAMMVITPGNGASFQWRATTGGTMSQSPSGGVSAPYWVKLVRTGSSFRGYMSADGGEWTQVGSAQTISMAGAVYVGLPVTAHDNTNLCTATFDNLWSTAPLGAWQHQDIGSVGAAGSATNSTSLFAVAGAGGDIWDNADAFNYAFLPVTNDCTIVARVTSVQNINVWSKAGVMIRASLDANAVNAYIAVTPNNGVTWQYRSSAGGTTANANTTGLNAPYWVKLVRSGNTFSGYRSPNGVTWTQQGTSQTFAMASTAYIGLAVTSHNSASLCTAAFDNVTAPGWPGLPAAPASLTATAGDVKVVLNWATTSNAGSYNVKSTTSSGGPYTLLTNVLTTGYTNTGLLNGTTYYYVVSSVNIAGESTNSLQAGATPAASPNLIISQTGTNFMFSWPAASAGFTLQATTNLASGNWATVTSAVPQLVGDQWLVALPFPTNAEPAYYRLTK